MNRYLNSTQLVESAKRRAMLPENQPTFTEQDFLDFATEEMDAAIIPYVMSYHEDYFLVSEDIPITSGVDKYAIPYRAVGNKLRDIQWVDSSGNPYEMTRIGEGDEPYFNWGRSILRPFYIKGNQAVLPRNSYNYAGGNLRFIYYIRPNRLVTQDRVATITAINTPVGGTVTMTLSSIPDNFSPLIVNYNLQPTLTLPANAVNNAVLTFASTSLIEVQDLLSQRQYVTINQVQAIADKLSEDSALSAPTRAYFAAYTINAGAALNTELSTMMTYLNSATGGAFNTTFSTNSQTLQTEYNSLVTALNTSPLINQTNFQSISGYTDVQSRVTAVLSSTDVQVTGTEPFVQGDLILYKYIRSASGQLIDIIQTKSPHKCLAIDIASAVINASPGTITINEEDFPAGLAVGDYIALAEECVIPQIPTDLHSMLAQRIACRCLEALGDQAGLQAANAKLAEMEQKLATVVDSRVEDAPMKVNARHTFLRANRRYRRFLGF